MKRVDLFNHTPGTLSVVNCPNRHMAKTPERVGVRAEVEQLAAKRI
jgi:hypothetical protein